MVNDYYLAHGSANLNTDAICPTGTTCAQPIRSGSICSLLDMVYDPVTKKCKAPAAATTGTGSTTGSTGSGSTGTGSGSASGSSTSGGVGTGSGGNSTGTTTPATTSAITDQIKAGIIVAVILWAAKHFLGTGKS